MAATLKIDNFGSINLKESTQLDADAAAAANSFTLKNSIGYNAGDTVVLGQLGTDLSENLVISSIAAEVLTTTGNSKLAHKRFEQVTSLLGDSIRIYSAPNANGSQPADNAFTLLATVGINFDNPTTTYVDNAGGSAFWYKFTYFNSASSAETQLADSSAARGGGYGHYVSVDEIRQEAGFKGNTNVTDGVIDSYRIDAEAEIDSQLGGIYATPFAQPVPGVISNIAKLLAAGFLLYAEYGAVTSGSPREGTQKIKDARDMINRLQARSMTLNDQQGNSLVLQTAVTSWPDDSTFGLGEYDETGNFAHGGDTAFTISKRF